MVTDLSRDDREWGTVHRWRAGDGETYYFSGFDKEECVRRALVFDALYDRVECEVSPAGTIPIEVATAGRPYIAAFLYSVHQESVDDIAERFEVSEATVRQYFSDIRHDRR